MKKVELEIIAVSHSIMQSSSYVVVLGEVDGTRRMPIVIGAFEAQAIAVVLENMHPRRPLTHDLMKNFMNAFNVELMEIVISDYQESIFYSKLVCVNVDDTVEIDSRTSDAIALAIRFGCRIYTYEHILDATTINLENDQPKKKQEITVESPSTATSNDDLRLLSIEALQNLLNEVLENEDYIKAIAIRDEINKRK